jgi:hypothetical protein
LNSSTIYADINPGTYTLDALNSKGFYKFLGQRHQQQQQQRGGEKRKGEKEKEKG